MVVDNPTLNRVVESDETNNANQGLGLDSDSAAVLAPDLMGTYFNADEDLSWGQSFNVTAGVWNGSPIAADWTAVDFYLSADETIGDEGDVWLGWSGLRPLAGWDWALIHDRLQMPDSAPLGFSETGAVYVGMVEDNPAINRVVESDETNNANRGDGLDSDQATVGEQAPADLVGTYFRTSSPVQWGGTAVVSYGVWNASSGSADASEVHFYLSADTTIGDAGDVWLGSSAVRALAAWDWQWNGGVTLSMPTTAPAGFSDTGVAFIGMTVDAIDQVAETNEANNASIWHGADYHWTWLSGSAVLAKAGDATMAALADSLLADASSRVLTDEADTESTGVALAGPTVSTSIRSALDDAFASGTLAF
jgi:hypothetical protein